MEAPIGLFDSGFGGLTVMKEIVKLLPNENLIYLGDTANLPYGNKSPETVIRCARANAAFLLERGIKLLIIPCHTACCHALEILKQELPIPIVGVIEPGLQLVHNFRRIAILGTTSTIESGLYQTQIRKQNSNVEIFAKACPLFVPLIEEGFHEHITAKLIAQHYLDELKGKIDAALLACTHYPLLRKVLDEELGANVALIEPAVGCAQIVKKILVEKNQLRIQKEKPHYQFFASDDPEKFRKFGKLFFGTVIEKVEKNKKL
ncbi:MAG: glutamate racemase [Parachlamydiales bacterium]|nr:glutamate racemase [Parachlamydiales bacterium]